MGKAAEMVKRWVELYNDGTPENYGSDRFTELYSPDLDWVEYPTQLNPSGRSGDREKMREVVEELRVALRNRKLEIDGIVEEGAVAALLGTWTVTIGIDGLDTPRGSRIKIRMAIIMEVHNNMIIRQRDYIAFPEVV